MTRIGFLPRVVNADVPEVRGDESPEDYTVRLALEKAAWVAEREHSADEEWILAADTVVVYRGEVLEKPTDPTHAREMIASLNNDRHTVVTSFCWQNLDGRTKARTVTADVIFRELNDAWIDRYIACGESMDKAGAYGIQAVGATLVRAIEGSYFCVMGLPVCEVVETLQEMGGVPEYPFHD